MDDDCVEAEAVAGTTTDGRDDVDDDCVEAEAVAVAGTTTDGRDAVEAGKTSFKDGRESSLILPFRIRDSLPLEPAMGFLL